MYPAGFNAPPSLMDLYGSRREEEEEANPILQLLEQRAASLNAGLDQGPQSDGFGRQLGQGLLDSIGTLVQIMTAKSNEDLQRAVAQGTAIAQRREEIRMAESERRRQEALERQERADEANFQVDLFAAEDKVRTASEQRKREQEVSDDLRDHEQALELQGNEFTASRNIIDSENAKQLQERRDKEADQTAAALAPLVASGQLSEEAYNREVAMVRSGAPSESLALLEHQGRVQAHADELRQAGRINQEFQTTADTEREQIQQNALNAQRQIAFWQEMYATEYATPVGGIKPDALPFEQYVAQKSGRPDTLAVLYQTVSRMPADVPFAVPGDPSLVVKQRLSNDETGQRYAAHLKSLTPQQVFKETLEMVQNGSAGDRAEAAKIIQQMKQKVGNDPERLQYIELAERRLLGTADDQLNLGIGALDRLFAGGAEPVLRGAFDLGALPRAIGQQFGAAPAGPSITGNY